MTRPRARRLDAGDDVVVIGRLDVDAEVARFGGVAIGVDQPLQHRGGGDGVEKKRDGGNREHRAHDTKHLPHDGYCRPSSIAFSPPLGLS